MKFNKWTSGHSSADYYSVNMDNRGHSIQIVRTDRNTDEAHPSKNNIINNKLKSG